MIHMVVNNSLDVEIRASGYENIYYDCPKCRKENILNRISDIGNDMPISRLDNLVCQNDKCKQLISILGDTVTDAKYRWFIDELHIFSARKEYRSYVLSLCQGLEAFFYQAIINKKFDRNPLYRNGDGSLKLSRYRSATSAYNGLIFKFTFFDMRKEFIETFQEEINEYKPYRNFLREDLRSISFKEIENTDIHNVRNQVVHKHALRPSSNDIKRYNNLIKSIYWISNYLDVQDSMFILNKKDIELEA